MWYTKGQYGYEYNVSIVERTGSMKHPDRQECERLLNEYKTPEHVKGHCRAVADMACTVAEELNKHGFDLDTELILAAGLLHDIARVEDRHWDVGAELMDELGYHEEAKIIKVHMTYSPFSDINDVNETDLVCLGDRTVLEDEYVGLDKRIDYVIDKAKKNGNPQAEPIILEKKKQTRGFISQIEDVIGMSLDDLMKGKE
ncbi:MAG: HD domain-containing protein [Firmicutes bacterium]|nr:HD domain-containing protein [Bacillota bacterium]